MHQIILTTGGERIHPLGQIILEYQNVFALKWVTLLLLKLLSLSFKVHTAPQRKEKHFPPFFSWLQTEADVTVLSSPLFWKVFFEQKDFQDI